MTRGTDYLRRRQGTWPLAVLAGAQRTAVPGTVDILAHATSLDNASMSKVETDMLAHDAELARQLASYRVSAADPRTVDAFTSDWKTATDIRDRPADLIPPAGRVLGAE